MLHRLINGRLRLPVILCVLVAALFLYVWASPVTNHAQPETYIVLEDTMQTTMKIGLAANVGKKQLQATLARAADDHQNDSARDLLLSDYFWVEGYLLNGDTRSTLPAGKLRRYVPPKRAKGNKDWLDRISNLVGTTDKFYITLDEARHTLQ